MIKAVSSLRCLAFEGASSKELSGHRQVPGPRRHDQGCVSLLHCLVFVGASSTEQSGHLQVPASRRHDQGCVIILHCLVFVGASSTEQSGHLQVPASRRHDQGCVIIALPCLCRRQLQRAAGPPSGAWIDDMIKAVSSLHCLVFLGASSTEQPGHLQVPGSRRHDQGCVIIALPCLCRRQLHRAVGSPSGARVKTT